MQTYYAHITHDGLKEDNDVPQGKQKVLVYLAITINWSEADKQFRELETQFQGQNFKILMSGQLSTSSNHPVFMGVELQEIPFARRPH